MPEADRHWLNINYFEELQRQNLEQSEEYFVLAHDLQEPVLRSTTWLRYRGVVSCHGSIEVHVDHRLERDHSNRVRTAVVSYHAQICEPRLIPILRYDNAHSYTGHPDLFHKHLFDVDGHPAGVEHVGRDAFPTLRNVIDEVFEWWKRAKSDPHHQGQEE